MGEERMRFLTRQCFQEEEKREGASSTPRCVFYDFIWSGTGFSCKPYPASHHDELWYTAGQDECNSPNSFSGDPVIDTKDSLQIIQHLRSHQFGGQGCRSERLQILSANYRDVVNKGLRTYWRASCPPPVPIAALLHSIYVGLYCS